MPESEVPAPRGPEAYPYATHLNVLFPALEKIALDPLVAAVRDRWYNVMHRTRAPERSVALMIETANVVPTGS